MPFLRKIQYVFIFWMYLPILLHTNGSFATTYYGKSLLFYLVIHLQWCSSFWHMSSPCWYGPPLEYSWVQVVLWFHDFFSKVPMVRFTFYFLSCAPVSILRNSPLIHPVFYGMSTMTPPLHVLFTNSMVSECVLFLVGLLVLCLVWHLFSSIKCLRSSHCSKIWTLGS